MPPVSILDGKRSACDWPDDPNAVAPGLMDPREQPRLIRSDFVGNRTDVVFGSGFVQEVGFTADGPPQTSSLLTYSQSADPTSPHYADQTRLFSAGQWVTERFTEEQIAASPQLEVEVLN
ncbi:hypothetical protein ACE1SV_67460 [Streptomyces sennicomposti]